MESHICKCEKFVPSVTKANRAFNGTHRSRKWFQLLIIVIIVQQRPSFLLLLQTEKKIRIGNRSRNEFFFRLTHTFLCGSMRTNSRLGSSLKREITGCVWAGSFEASAKRTPQWSYSGLEERSGYGVCRSRNDLAPNLFLALSSLLSLDLWKRLEGMLYMTNVIVGGEGSSDWASNFHVYYFLRGKWRRTSKEEDRFRSPRIINVQSWHLSLHQAHLHYYYHRHHLRFLHHLDGFQ